MPLALVKTILKFVKTDFAKKKRWMVYAVVAEKKIIFNAKAPGGKKIWIYIVQTKAGITVCWTTVDLMNNKF